MKVGDTGESLRSYGEVLPLPEERQRIVAVAERRLRAAQALLERDELARVDLGTASWRLPNERRTAELNRISADGTGVHEAENQVDREGDMFGGVRAGRADPRF